MTELTLTLIKLGFLAVLWLFVLSAVSVIRSDIFGAKVDTTRAPQPQPPRQKKSKQPRAPKGRKPKRGMPSTLVVTDGSAAISSRSFRNSSLPRPGGMGSRWSFTMGLLLVRAAGRRARTAARLDLDGVGT